MTSPGLNEDVVERDDRPLRGPLRPTGPVSTNVHPRWKPVEIDGKSVEANPADNSRLMSATAFSRTRRRAATDPARR